MKPACSLSLRTRGEGWGEGLCLALLLCSCATTGPITAADAKRFSERRYAAATDEVYDATWLALEALGAKVIDGDRLAGTFIATREAGATIDIDIAALGSEQRLSLTPREPVPGAEWAALLDGVNDRVRATIKHWHDLPEWKFDGRRNSLTVAGYSVQPPADWAWLDYDVSRRRVTVQEKRARGVVNATLVIDFERRQTRPSFAVSLQRATGLLLASRLPLTFPDELDATEDARGTHGTLRVSEGAGGRDVVWHAAQVPLGDAQVTLVMTCEPQQARACAALWADVFASQVMR